MICIVCDGPADAGDKMAQHYELFLAALCLLSCVLAAASTLDSVWIVSWPPAAKSLMHCLVAGLAHAVEPVVLHKVCPLYTSAAADYLPCSHPRVRLLTNS